MFHSFKQKRHDASLGRQAREIATALHELAIQANRNGIGGHVYRATEPALPEATAEERLVALSSIIVKMVPLGAVDFPNKIYALTLYDGTYAIQLGEHRDAIKLALPPAVDDYVRYGIGRIRAAA